MSRTVISVERLGKRYRLGASASHNTLRDHIAEGVGNLLRRKKLSPPTDPSDFWALKDVSFEVTEGEVLGVIGRNGAGKSTLLKVLSQITEPTEGEVRVRGRSASLLEVGTGFHPELSGRENIFLNGAILGMSRTEIKRKFDEIVAFAEVEKFLDTPVKRYSSGMYVRLAFAVAAHLEPEILILDEVLAVGDVEFQKKCMGKMGEVAHGGRTVLFVSHNMSAITSLCTRCILLEKGKLKNQGPTREVVTAYQLDSVQKGWEMIPLAGAHRSGSGEARFLSVQLLALDGERNVLDLAHVGCDLEATLCLEADQEIRSVNIAIIVYDSNGYRLIDANGAMLGQTVNLPKGRSRAKFRLSNVLLNQGVYTVGLWMGIGGVREIDSIEHAVSVDFVNNVATTRNTENFPGSYRCDFKFHFEEMV